MVLDLEQDVEAIPLNLKLLPFLSGVFLTLLVQTVVHIGMNMGLFPITGVPLPLVSAGGSSLLATSITLGMAISTKKLTLWVTSRMPLTK